MISALVFSRDRACQLDLFLRSVTSNASNLIEQTTVLWRATDAQHRAGYHICMDEHDDVEWVEERDFPAQTLDLLDDAMPLHSFFTDDSVFYRSLEGSTDPCDLIAVTHTLLCFSLRLGLHTGTCYPLMRLQGLPVFESVNDVLYWYWRTGDADFGYMGSLDGHIFRKEDLQDMFDGSKSFKNPNELEEIFAKEVYGSMRSLAACHTQSHLVGIPVNIVNETHPNRFGDHHETPARDLNNLYLTGKRIDIASIKADRVAAAHMEMEYRFYDA